MNLEETNGKFHHEFVLHSLEMDISFQNRQNNVTAFAIGVLASISVGSISMMSYFGTSGPWFPVSLISGLLSISLVQVWYKCALEVEELENKLAVFEVMDS